MAIGIGVLLGHFYPELGTQMKPLGDGFVKLIKMIPSYRFHAFHASDAGHHGTENYRGDNHLD